MKSPLALPLGRLTADMMEACIWLGAPIGSQRETVGNFDDILPIVAVVVEVSALLVLFSCATTQASKHETQARCSILGGQPFSRRYRVLRVNCDATGNMGRWQGKGRDGCVRRSGPTCLRGVHYETNDLAEA